MASTTFALCIPDCSRPIYRAAWFRFGIDSGNRLKVIGQRKQQSDCCHCAQARQRADGSAYERTIKAVGNVGRCQATAKPVARLATMSVPEAKASPQHSRESTLCEVCIEDSLEQDVGAECAQQ